MKKTVKCYQVNLPSGANVALGRTKSKPTTHPYVLICRSPEGVETGVRFSPAAMRAIVALYTKITSETALTDKIVEFIEMAFIATHKEGSWKVERFQP